MQIAIHNKSIGADTVPTVNAREIHTSLGVSKDFSDWIKAQIKRALLAEGVDYVVAESLSTPKGGTSMARPQKTLEYHLTIEAGKNIAMLSGTAKGKEVRAYFIECEKKVQAGLPMVKDPRTAMMIETLVKLDQVEQEQQRQSSELARMQETVAVLEARTQPENKHFTVLGYSNLIGSPVDLQKASKIGRKCAELSRARGVLIGDVSDPRFGRVHSYHESILQEVFA